MKKQIDELVQNIQRTLACPPAANQYVAAAFVDLQIDGLSVAIDLRAVLMNWTVDVLLSPEDRAYAAQELGSLPDF
jgi:hypothetical protein